MGLWGSLILIIIFSFHLEAKESFSLSCPSDNIQQIDAQYLFFGEDHRDYTPALFWKTLAPKLKKLGFDYLFAEYLDSNDQLAIDQYQNSPRNLERQFIPLIQGWGYDFKKYYDLSQHIIEASITLKGLDKRHDLKGIFPGTKWMSIRDQHMFHVAANFIDSNPEAKIIFFNGSSHSYVNRHSESPTFYEYFVNTYGSEKTLNLKFDYYDPMLISLQRLELYKMAADEPINLNCPSKTYFLKEKQPSHFYFHIFKDNEKAMPITDSRGIVL